MGGETKERNATEPAAAAVAEVLATCPAVPASAADPEQRAEGAAEAPTEAPTDQPPRKRQRIPIPCPPAPTANGAAAPASEPAEHAQAAQQPPPKPSTAFLAHYLTGLERGNERRAAGDASRAGLAALGQAAQAAARPLLQLAAPKGDAAVQQAAMQAASQVRQAACVGMLTEVARLFGFHLTVHVEAEEEAAPGGGGSGGGEEGARELAPHSGDEQQQQQQAAGEQPVPLAPLVVRLQPAPPQQALQPPQQAESGEAGRSVQEHRNDTSRQDIIQAILPAAAGGGRLVVAALANLGASPARPPSRQGAGAAAPAAVNPAAQPAEGTVAPPAATAEESGGGEAGVAGEGTAKEAEPDAAPEGGRPRKRQQLVGSGLFSAALADLGAAGRRKSGGGA